MTKKRLRIAAFAAAALLCLGGVTACDAKSSAEDSYYSASQGSDYSAMENASEEYSASDTAKNPDSSVEFDDKIVRTADVYVESKDAQKCYDTLLEFAKQNGGSELNIKKSHNAYGGYDHFNIEATLKISPDKLEDFISLAEKTDKVTSSQISADDVTQEYYDIKLRLDTKKAALSNYYKMLEEAQNVQDSLEIQRYITDLTAEIESMEGMLKYYDSKVDLSTINLNIEQSDKLPADIDGDFQWASLSLSDVGTLIKNGLLGVLNLLWMIIVWAFIAVVVLSPILLIAVAIFFVVRNFRNKDSNTSSSKDKPQ